MILLILSIMFVAFLGFLAYNLFFKEADFSEALLFSLPFGIGIYGIGLFLVNLRFELNFKTVFLTLNLLLFIVLIASLIKKIRLEFSFKIESKCRYLVVIAGIVLGLMLLHNIVVPIDNYDSLSYHLPFAKTIYESGGLPKYTSPSYSEVFYAYPPVPYLVYASSYFIYGGINHLFPKILPWVFGVLCLALLIKISNLISKKQKISLVAVLLALATPAITYLIVNENTDVYFAFFFLASVYFLIRFFREKTYNLLVLAAIMLALSYWIKYLGLAAILAFFLVLAYLVFTKKFNFSAKNLAVFCLIAGILVLPHLLRNYILFQNPIYPYLANMFGGDLIDSWSLSSISSFYHPSLFYNLSPGIIFNIEYGAVLLLFIPFLFGKKNNYEKFIMLISLAYFIIWFIFLGSGNSNYTRLLLPSFLLFMLLVSRIFTEGFKKLEKKILLITLSLGSAYLIYSWISLRTSLGLELLYIGAKYGVTLFSMLLLGGFTIFAKKEKMKTLLLLVLLLPSLFMVFGGFTDALVVRKDAFAAFSPRYLPGGEWMQENLPKDALILTFEDRTYLIPRKVFPADTPLLKEIYTYTSAEKAVLLLKQYNISYVYPYGREDHVLYNQSVIYNNLDDSRYFSLIYNGTQKNERVYKIN